MILKRRACFRVFAGALVLLSHAWLVVAAADGVDWVEVEDSVRGLAPTDAGGADPWVLDLRRAREAYSRAQEAPEDQGGPCRELAAARDEAGEALARLRWEVEQAKLRFSQETGQEDPGLRRASQKLARLSEQLVARGGFLDKGTVGACGRR